MEKHSRPEQLVKATAAGVIATVIVGSALYAVVSEALPFPYWDEWEFVAALEQSFYPGRYVEFFFSQHNEHRILFPRIIFSIDYFWFHGSGAFNIACIILVQIAHALLLSRIASRWSRSFGGQTAAPPAFAITLCWCFYLGQHDNFLVGFQVGFVGVFACATASLYSLLRYAESRERTGGPAARWLVAATGFAFVGTFTMANGILIWVMLATVAALLRLPAKALLPILAASVIAGSAFFYDYDFPARPHTPLAYVLSRPVLLLQFTLAYLGNVARPLGSTGALWVGAAGLITCGLTAWASWKRASVRLPALTLLGIAGFVAASALMTGAARLGGGLDGALQSRYVAGSSTFWAAMIFPAYVLVAARAGTIRTTLHATFFPAVLGLLVVAQFSQLSEVDGYRRSRRPAVSALLTGVADDQALTRIFPDPGFVRLFAPVLVRDGASVFHRPEYAWLGKLRDELFGETAAGVCLGDFDDLQPLKTGARVSGWAMTQPSGEPIEIIIVVDEQSEIVGLAYGGFHRRDIARRYPDRAGGSNYGWRGHTRFFHGSATAYGVIEGGGLCAIPNRREYPDGSLGEVNDGSEG